MGVTIHPFKRWTSYSDIMGHQQPTPLTRAATCCEAERVVAAFPASPPGPCVPFIVSCAETRLPRLPR